MQDHWTIGRTDAGARQRHRLANMLQMVLTLIAREASRTRNPDTLAVLRRLAADVQDLAPAGADAAAD